MDDWNDSTPVRKPAHPILILVALVAVSGYMLMQKYSGGRPATQAASPSDAEARVNVLALCDAVQAHRDEHGVYVTAGPTPKAIPRGGRAVPFPKDETFHRLGFEPDGKVHFQYQVVVQESPVGEPEVSCLARGDFDGDGLNSLYRVRLDANGMTTPIEVEREGE
ncbi:hypothetical protein HV824_27745 [Myxococcus sp. AM009]|uniref:hypothetical protein n=1 Tax=unclassified Myxococcus TaxID=2648731 RepID=UPI001595151C|nr:MULTISPECIES: hypothetical protein [unclassified Myxococcus]NVJ01893.1 hypothetical protein [Myxococcus sp. AM009]NVJ13236.1 hypothetical protein [Myxococcus sp. AM010]